MLPNIQSPIDRSERVRQRMASYRAPRAKVRGGVTNSGIACTLCQLGCSALSGSKQAACLAVCNATVCS